MGFKDLFINSDSDDNKKQKVETTQKSFTSKFPSSGPVNETKVTTPQASTNVEITPDNPACTPHLDKIMALYEEGFNGLNMDGYDFFEYFQAVVQTGLNNPSMYGMALTMAKAMDSKVTKESLISQSKFYIDEINKVHDHYVINGTAKRESALKAKGNEEANLAKELEDINSEIQRLTRLKSEKESALVSIDSKYTPEITDVECKLMANDIARERILASINSVVDGIKKNIN
jgi:hypothetical protein